MQNTFSLVKYGALLRTFYFLAFIANCLLPVTNGFSQAPPQGINYQAVARDVAGNPIASQTIPVVFIIHQSSASGPISWNESQSISTNQFGLFTWVIGSSNPTGFDSITWGKHKYFLEVKVNNISMGTTQFMSVPYAFHAHTADSVKNLPSGTGPWTINSGSIYPTVLSDSVGIGTSSPKGKLSVFALSGSSDAFNVGHQGFGHAGVFAQSNPANDSACLVSYTNGKGAAVFGINMGAGHGGVFALSNASSSGYGLIGSTNGKGKAVFGYQTGTGYGGVFAINNQTNDSAALVGMTNGIGSAGYFIATNPSNPSPALTVAVANPAAPSAVFMGGNVGIGTTTPGVKLDVVNGSIRADAGNNPSIFEALFLKGGSGGDPAQGGEIQMTNTYSGAVTPSKYLRIDQLGNFQILNNAYSSTLFNVMDNGNVGIGTAAPASSLEVNGAFATTIKTITSSTTLDNTAEVWYTTTSGITLALPAASLAKYRRYIIVYKGTVATSINISSSYIPLGLTSGTVGNNTSIEIISDGSNWLQIK